MTDTSTEAIQARFDAMQEALKKIDAYANVRNMFGTSRDPYVNTHFASGTVFQQQEIEARYRFDWMVRRVIDALPEDALREWIDFKTEDEEVVKKVNDKLKQIKAKKKLNDGLSFGRLYGGAIGVLVTTGSGEPEEPLTELYDIVGINILDRWQVQVEKTFSDPLAPDFGEPEIYRLTPRRGEQTINNKIHSSRVLRFDGARLTEQDKISNDGWDDSIIIALQDALKAFGLSLQTGSQLFVDFVTKVLQIENAKELLATTEGRAVLQTRLQAAIANVSNMSIVFTDGAEGSKETFSKIQTPIQGFVDLVKVYIDIMAAAAGMPKTRLFGQQIGTLAGAEEDTRGYYDKVGGYQEDKVEPHLIKIIELILISKNGPTKGIIPDDWTLTFNSLWKTSEKEEAEIREIMSKADEKYLALGVVGPEEIASSRFGPDGFSIETVLDFEAREEMANIEETISAEGEENE
jgi:phage-related protein (TIGR01555 family)